MAKRVKERYDARQYVAAAFGGLVLEACCLLLAAFFLAKLTCVQN
jgi:hypothetical protein